MTSLAAPLLILFLICCHLPIIQAFTSGGLLPTSKKESQLKMGWSDTWSDILNGGSKRWKVDDIEAKKKALAHIIDATATAVSSDKTPLRILCPLAGDDPFVHYAWSQGHDVTAIDIVPDALKEMRSQFVGEENGGDEDWSSSDSTNPKNGIVWKHKSGRATLYEGDMLMKRPELQSTFDVIYDKDSFGALNLDMRKAYCQRLSEYIKNDGVVYVEVKNKESGREFGPPYHVEKEDLMEETSFGDAFDYVASLGEVYPLNMGSFRQMGHILRRALRK